MDETRIGYSVFDSGTKDNMKDSTNSLNKSSNGRRSHVTVKLSTLYVIAIVVAIVFVGGGIIMYLGASGDRDCKMVLPEGYELSPTNVTRKDKLVATGCPTTWLSYGQSCYFLSNDSSTWLEAMIQCIKLGGYLVEINSMSENQYLQAQAKQSGSLKECYNETPNKYKGLVNKTYKGRTCQRWDSQFPHRHSRNNITRFPDTSLTDAANYCRDPDGEGLPWCYTTDPVVRWQFCGIYKCPGNFWIGLTDQTKGTSWLWITSGTPITSYKNWGPGEPSIKWKTYQRCGSLSAESNPLWSDENCFNPAFYICEI